MQLRSIASQVSWRLRSQPVSLFIDQHVDKVRSVAEYENRKLLEEIATAPPPKSAEQPKTSSGEKVARVGGILLGVSVVVGATGLLLASSASGGSVVGLVMITAGVLGAAGGLVTLLVGLIMMAAA
jgi:hypothetical protein